MTVHNLFKNSPFGPEEIGVLTSAYEQTLRTLGLQERNDPLTEMVARKIISLAQTGVRDASALCRARDRRSRLFRAPVRELASKIRLVQAAFQR